MQYQLKIYKSTFFYLLILFIMHAVGTSIAPNTSHNEIPTAVLFTFIVLFCFLVIPYEKYLLLLTIILGAISLTFHIIINLSVHPGKFLYIYLYANNIIFLAIITYSVLYTVTKHKQVTADTLFGAINGYFLLGYTWAFIYLLIETINPAAFSVHMTNLTPRDCELFFIYYSFATMTTVSYGDMLPVSHLARTCSWLQAMTGQIYLAVWISQLVGLRIAQKNQHN